MKPNVTIRTLALAALILALAACQTELETVTASHELEIIIPEMQPTWNHEEGTTTRITDPDANGAQQWQTGDILRIVITFNAWANRQDITATRTAAGGWDFSAPIKLPLNAASARIRTSYTGASTLGSTFHNSDLLYSETTVTFSTNKLSTDPVVLNPLYHSVSRIRFLGLAPGDKVWPKPNMNWFKVSIDATGEVVADFFATTDYVQADANGVATFYPLIYDLGLSSETLQFAITASTATSSAGSTWHDFDAGDPSYANGAYFNCTYVIANPEGHDGLGYSNEDEWVKMQMLELGYTYVVQTPEDLVYLAQQVNNGNAEMRNAKVIQTADIDMTGKTTSVGTTDNPFAGLYNGNAYTVKGLTKPVFGVVTGGTLVSITVQGSTSENISVDGVLAGATNNAIVSKCTATGNLGLSTTLYIGGLIGIARNTAIDRCRSDCNITSAGGQRAIGGLVGWLENSTLIASEASGNITGEGYAGGLVGRNHGTIAYCRTLGGTISAIMSNQVKTAAIGGLAGANHVKQEGYPIGYTYNSYAAMDIEPENSLAAGLFFGRAFGRGFAINCHALNAKNLSLNTVGAVVDYFSDVITTGSAVGNTVRKDENSFTTKTLQAVALYGYPVEEINYKFTPGNVWTSDELPAINTALNPAFIQ